MTPDRHAHTSRRAQETAVERPETVAGTAKSSPETSSKLRSRQVGGRGDPVAMRSRPVAWASRSLTTAGHKEAVRIHPVTIAGRPNTTPGCPVTIAGHSLALPGDEETMRGAEGATADHVATLPGRESTRPIRPIPVSIRSISFRG